MSKNRTETSDGWDGIFLVGIVIGLVVLIFLWELGRFLRTGTVGDLSGQHPAQRMDEVPSDIPFVSILVPVWNGSADLPEFVSAFHQLSLPAELLLCVGGSDDGLAVAHSLASPSIQVIEQHPGEGKQAALARLLPLAQGPLVYLTDVDCRVSDACLLPIIRHLIENPEIGATTGSSRPIAQQMGSGFVRAQWSVEVAADPSQVTVTSGILGRNAAVYKRVLEATQAFHVAAPVGTDYTLAKELIRHGYPIHFVPAAAIESTYPAAFREYSRKQARWISNVLRLGMRYRAWNDVRGVLITTLFALMLPILLILGVVWWPLWILAGLLVLHSLVNRLRYERSTGTRLGVGGVVEHFLADQVAALLSAWRIVSGSVKW